MKTKTKITIGAAIVACVVLPPTVIAIGVVGAVAYYANKAK